MTTAKLDDLTKWRIKMLASYGGFSSKAIADRTGATASQVSSFLHRSAIKLTDWRNLTSPQSKSHANAVTKGGYLAKSKSRPKRRRKLQRAG